MSLDSLEAIARASATVAKAKEEGWTLISPLWKNQGHLNRLIQLVCVRTNTPYMNFKQYTRWIDDAEAVVTVYSDHLDAHPGRNRA